MQMNSKSSTAKELDKLIQKIMKGERDFTKEELQLYVNHSREIERRLLEEVR